MPDNVFRIHVTDDKGRKSTSTARVGGGPMTAEGLSNHLTKHNLFPGAESVEIEELGTTDELSLDKAIAAGPPRKITPRPTIRGRDAGSDPAQPPAATPPAGPTPRLPGNAIAPPAAAKPETVVAVSSPEKAAPAAIPAK